MSELLDDLRARGLVHDTTDPVALAERLAEGPITVYCGLDPTADSLHVGNLQSLLLLRRFHDAGHRVIALAGGATGLIGDPGGRDAERLLLDDATVSANVEAIVAQMRRFLDFGAGDNPAMLVDNREWTAPMSAIEFLRDVGKHVSVGTMLARDSVKNRLEREAGISFTEFSYMLLQANDFAVLHDRYGCELQVAGSDQWGNICAGIDLIRRQSGATVHGLTAPLIVASDGKKFGKSTGGGGVWLDAARTSPYQLFQYFMSTDDRDVGTWLCRLTLVPLDEIAAVVAAHSDAPELRNGQRRLASEVVSLVHGTEVLPAIEAATGLLFGGASEAVELSGDVLDLLRTELEVSDLTADAVAAGLVAAIADSFETSRGEVRRNAKGYRIDGVPVAERLALGDEVPAGEWHLVRKGKSDYRLLRIGPA